jgi:hypothetical protein
VSNGIRLNPAGPDWLERTSSPVLGMNAAYTKAGWIIFDGDLADGYVLMISDGGFSNYDAVYTFGSGTSARFQLECSGGSGGSSAALGSSITPGQWYYVALVRESATSLRLYVDGVLDAECTADVSGRAASAAQYLGSFGNLGGGFTLDGRLGYWRGWSDNLSTSEQTDEAVSPTPVRTADLFEDWPFDPGDLVNGAANNRDWSSAGSPTADDGPPDVVTGSGGEMAAELSGSGALAAVVRGDGMLAAAPAGSSSLAAVARGDGMVAAAIAGTGTLAATARGRDRGGSNGRGVADRGRLPGGAARRHGGARGVDQRRQRDQRDARRRGDAGRHDHRRRAPGGGADWHLGAHRAVRGDGDASARAPRADPAAPRGEELAAVEVRWVRQARDPAKLRLAQTA